MKPGARVTALLVLFAACGDAAPGVPALPSMLTALDGERVAPLPQAGDAAVVWVFVSCDCPIANAMAPEIAAIARDYAARGVRTLIVQVDAERSPAELRAHAREHALPAPIVVDGERALAGRAGALRTPTAVVFDRTGELRYRGRIDDTFAAPGQRRAQPTVRDLRAALDDVLAGRAVQVARTDAPGCAIEVR